VSDEKIIELIASTWVSNGGDRLGFTYCLLKILDKIEELENPNEPSRKELYNSLTGNPNKFTFDNT
jgi:hypothetical protein